MISHQMQIRALKKNALHATLVNGMGFQMESNDGHFQEEVIRNQNVWNHAKPIEPATSPQSQD